MTVLVLAACLGCGDDRGLAQLPTASVDGTRLVVVVSSCNGEPEVDEVVETSEEVVLTVVSTRQRGDGDGCADLVTVGLEEPLGARRLVDGSTGKPIEVSR